MDNNSITPNNETVDSYKGMNNDGGGERTRSHNFTQNYNIQHNKSSKNALNSSTNSIQSLSSSTNSSIIDNELNSGRNKITIHNNCCNQRDSNSLNTQKYNDDELCNMKLESNKSVALNQNSSHQKITTQPVLLRYSRSTLLKLRDDILSRYQPKCINDPLLMSLSVWKLDYPNYLPQNHHSGNNNNSSGNGNNNRNDKNSVDKDRDGSLRNHSDHSSRSSINHNSGGHNDRSESRGHNIIQQKSFNIDHRSMSSSHLMPAFVKRKIVGNSSQQHENIGGNNSNITNNLSDCNSSNLENGNMLKENHRLRKDFDGNNIILSPQRRICGPSSGGKSSPSNLNVIDREHRNMERERERNSNDQHYLNMSSNLRGGERRIGSGRIPFSRDWDYRSNEKDNSGYTDRTEHGWDSHYRNSGQNLNQSRYDNRKTENNNNNDNNISNNDNYNTNNNINNNNNNNDNNTNNNNNNKSNNNNNSTNNTNLNQENYRQNERYERRSYGRNSDFYDNKMLSGDPKLQYSKRCGIDNIGKYSTTNEKLNIGNNQYNEYNHHRHSNYGSHNSNNRNRNFDNYSDGMCNNNQSSSRHNNCDEPEWFSGGPTSQHDTIELHGFDEIENDANSNEMNSQSNYNKNHKNSVVESNRNIENNSNDNNHTNNKTVVSNSSGMQTTITTAGSGRIRKISHSIAKEYGIHENDTTTNNNNNNNDNNSKSSNISNDSNDSNDNQSEDLIKSKVTSDKDSNNDINTISNEQVDFIEDQKILSKQKDEKNNTEFNFDAFLNVDPLNNILGGESKPRFSRWFKSVEGGLSSSHSSLQEELNNIVSDTSENNKFFAQTSPSENSRQTLLQFLQRGKFNGNQQNNSVSISDVMPNQNVVQQMSGSLSFNTNYTTGDGKQKAISVEELEAKMREGGLPQSSQLPIQQNIIQSIEDSNQEKYPGGIQCSNSVDPFNKMFNNSNLPFQNSSLGTLCPLLATGSTSLLSMSSPSNTNNITVLSDQTKMQDPEAFKRILEQITPKHMMGANIRNSQQPIGTLSQQQQQSNQLQQQQQEPNLEQLEQTQQQKQEQQLQKQEQQPQIQEQQPQLQEQGEEQQLQREEQQQKQQQEQQQEKQEQQTQKQEQQPEKQEQQTQKPEQQQQEHQPQEEQKLSQQQEQQQQKQILHQQSQQLQQIQSQQQIQQQQLMQQQQIQQPQQQPQQKQHQQSQKLQQSQQQHLQQQQQQHIQHQIQQQQMQQQQIQHIQQQEQQQKLQQQQLQQQLQQQQNSPRNFSNLLNQNIEIIQHNFITSKLSPNSHNNIELSHHLQISSLLSPEHSNPDKNSKISSNIISGGNYEINMDEHQKQQLQIRQHHSQLQQHNVNNESVSNLGNGYNLNTQRFNNNNTSQQTEDFIQGFYQHQQQQKSQLSNKSKTQQQQGIQISTSCISPLPNGIIPSQRIPSPREIQIHTQNIIQNALIRKKLEEQQENYRRRQEIQQSSQSKHQQQVNKSQSGADIFLSEQQQNSSQLPSSSSTSSSINTQQPQQHQSSSTITSTQINSPTPTLAFTPTSVLRKMTAEKDSGNITSITNEIGISSNRSKLMQNLLMQIPQVQQQQQQQQNNSLPNQPRMILGGQQQQQLQHQAHNLINQSNPAGLISPLSPQSIHQAVRTQQQQQQQQQQQHQFKWNPNANQISFNKPLGRPILKGGSPSTLNQQQSISSPIMPPSQLSFASKIEYQQLQQQQQLQQAPQQSKQQEEEQKQQQPQQQQSKQQQQQNILNANQIQQQHLQHLQELFQRQQRAAGIIRAQQQQHQQPHQLQQPPHVQGHNHAQFGNIVNNIGSKNFRQFYPHMIVGGRHNENFNSQTHVNNLQQQQPQQQQSNQHQQQQHQQQQKQQSQSQSQNNAAINFQRGDGGLSPTSNQLARWFSPELLARASAGKLPSLNMGQALSLEEFERSIQHSSTAVLN